VEPILYGDLVNQALRLVDEFSKKGVANPVVKTADYRLKIPDAVNEIQQDLANTSGKLPKEMLIINNPVMGTAAYDTSTIKNHIPGTDDIAATLAGALSYFIEASGFYDIYFEEEISGVWTTLVHLEPTPGSEPTTFVELKGLLTPSSATNDVRIRLTGNYVYPYRNYILYPYTFPTAADVQQNRAWAQQLLPTDWLMLENVMIRRDIRQWIPFTEYEITPTYFTYNRYITGEIIVNYYRKPTPVAVVNTSAPTAGELAQVIDAAPGALYIVPAGVAGKILAVDSPSASSELLNYYETRKYTLPGLGDRRGSQSILNVTGW